MRNYEYRSLTVLEIKSGKFKAFFTVIINSTSLLSAHVVPKLGV